MVIIPLDYCYGQMAQAKGYIGFTQGDKSIKKHKGFIKHFVYFTTVYETLKNVLLFKLLLLNELFHENLVLIT